MNEEDSNKVWKRDTSTDYHLFQYDNEYESVKFLKEQIKDLEIKDILDIGCGAGSFCYHLLKVKNVKFYGIDINEKFINYAKEMNPESHFYCSCHNTYETKHDLVISSQVLLCVSPSYQKSFIENKFKLSNKYVMFHSLFTESLLDFEIKIKDPYNNETVYYNILPVSRIEKIGESMGFKLIKNIEFEIKKELEKPDKKGRKTYTVKTFDDKLLQFSDIIYLPSRLLVFKKNI
tara:strand:+ start:12899 stop:13597 length:699 start_codon:yes stop_codon:yes gene_type:complete